MRSASALALAAALLAVAPTAARADEPRVGDAPTANASADGLAAEGRAAGRAPARIVCAARAPLTETPGGLVVGSVARGDRVFVLKRAKGRKWIRVRTDFATRGWMKSSQLCG